MNPTLDSNRLIYTERIGLLLSGMGVNEFEFIYIIYNTMQITTVMVLQQV